MKQHLNTIIIAAAIVITAIFFTTTYKNRNRSNDLINVTGLGSKDFKSDLIIWDGNLSVSNPDMKLATAALDQSRETVRKYITSKGVDKKEVVFSSVVMNKDYRTWIDAKDEEHTEFTGYTLSQTVTIESKDVEKVEMVSREVTELISQGIEISSNSPEYYYTKLGELKIEMVAAATEDARTRAEQIAKNANAGLGHLRFAQMGVFQITAQNSSDDYSWGGSFNTDSKMKTANITMKLQFGIE
jgi:uncharacterized protein